MSSVRAFRLAVGILGIATAVGLALLWPGEVEPRLSEGLLSKTEGAEVERVEPFKCSGFGTDRCRRVTIRVLSGPDEGRRTRIELGAGGLDPDVAVGDRLRVVRGVAAPGVGDSGPLYSLADFERRRPLLLMTIAFAALVVLFGRLRGALSLVGLALSLAIVLLFVVPAILDGSEPLLVAVVGSFAVMLATILLAHGTGPKSLAAILGTAASLLLTVLLAVGAREATHLTGLAGEEAALLQGNESGIPLQGLLLAGMVIGALGVLDDVTISQSSTVLALRRASPSLDGRGLFQRALEVGRDHVSATVNTLVLAYVGASLPLLLIFSSGQLGFADAVTLELIAQEVVSMLVGSTGLIAAVPITTALAAFMSQRMPVSEVEDVAHSH